MNNCCDALVQKSYEKFLSLDFFSTPVSLTHNRKKAYTTLLGNSLSVFIILATVIYAISLAFRVHSKQDFLISNKSKRRKGIVK